MSEVKQSKDHGKVQYGMIGVGLQAMTREFASAMGLPDSRGALVRDVTPGAPGEKAGLQPGDVIRSVDGRAIHQSSDLPPIIGAKAPGRPEERRVGNARLLRVYSGGCSLMK